MAGPLHIAAQRINTSVAGLTGPASDPAQEPGAPQSVGLTEALDLVPSEFGGLTHLFGGEAAPSTQHAPVNPALEIPAGSVQGRLGGLIPDARNTAAHAVETARTYPGTVLPPFSTAVQNNWNKFRAWAKF